MAEEQDDPELRLADLPLDDAEIGDVIVLRALTRESEHGCEIRVFAPITRSGLTPPTEPSVLAYEPEFEMLRSRRSADPVAFGTARAEGGWLLVRAQIAFPEGTSFYGTGEVAGPLRRNGRTTEFWNTDTWAYDEECPGLYQSHPYVLAIEPDGSAVGVLAKSFRRGQVKLCADGIDFEFEAEPFDVYRIEGPSPAAVQRALAELVGRIDLPPLWTLGYHQCRWSYVSADEIRTIAREFRERKLPCAAIWFDIDYMDRFRVFTWDAERFPDPPGLVRELHEQGLHAVAILDPGIAIARAEAGAGRPEEDGSYEAYTSGLAGGHFVLDANLAPARGKVWPGVCHFPDFSRPATRAWWGEHVAAFLSETGMDGLWNDMNEPSVFGVPSQTLGYDTHHEGFGGGTHARFHNLYGQWMAESTHAAMRASRPERRPFVLTRSAHLGTARVAATWTGDNQARWEDLRWSISMTLNLGLSGQPFVGPDIGGFVGDPDAELFERWFELGAFLPFCRGHAEKTSCRKEPWAFGAETEARVRAALLRREALRPYLYSLFETAAREGLPIVRPLFFADPGDLELNAIDDAFLLGDDVLVAPIVYPEAVSREVHLPAGEWYALRIPGVPAATVEAEGVTGCSRFEAGVHALDAPRGTTPVFARAGSIVPLRRFPEDRESDTVELLAFLDGAGAAGVRTYEDAGEGYGHESGAYRRLALTLRRTSAQGAAGPAKVELQVEIEGSYAGAPIDRLWVHDRDGSAVEYSLPPLQAGRIELN